MCGFYVLPAKDDGFLFLKFLVNIEKVYDLLKYVNGEVGQMLDAGEPWI